MMHRDVHEQRSPAAGHLAKFPALAKLHLTGADLGTLAHQGFVSEERRQDRTYYKLRFRSAGRQVVRYVGGATAAAAIEAELQQLRAGRRCQRELAELDRVTRRMLRESKAQLEPLLASRGLRFHGRAIRRPRQSGQPIHVTFSQFDPKEIIDVSIQHPSV